MNDEFHNCNWLVFDLDDTDEAIERRCIERCGALPTRIINVLGRYQQRWAGPYPIHLMLEEHAAPPAEVQA